MWCEEVSDKSQSREKAKQEVSHKSGSREKRKVGCYCMYNVKREGRVNSVKEQFGYLVTLKQIASD